MEKTIAEFLTFLKVPVSPAYCERLISSHADYPSLLSIADVLNRLGIPNVIGKIEKSKLDDLRFPYLLQVNKQSGTIIDIRNKGDLIAKKEDLRYWDGIVLHIEPAAVITDAENNHVYEKEKFYSTFKFILISVIFAVLLWPVAFNFNFFTFLLFVTSALGLLVGYLLVAKELGIKYKVVENFCTSGKNSDCDKLLRSEDAKLFGPVKLSDAVLAYFIFQTVFVSVSAAFTQFMTTVFLSLSILGFLLIPVVLYSLYYQYFKAGTWCRLCLIVAGVLTCQVLLFGYYMVQSNSPTAIDVEVLFLELLVFAAINCASLMFKDRIEMINELNKLLPKAARVKNTAAVFNQLMRQEKRQNTASLNSEICIGNVNAAVRIVMVSNLFCNPCKEQHEVVEQLVNTFPDQVTVAFRLVVSKDRNSNVYLIQYWLKHIHNKFDESLNTQKLFHDWYDLMDLEKFKVKYPMESTDRSDAEEMINDHVRWINQQGIVRTPTFYINGYPLPKDYDMSDMASLVLSLGHELKTSMVAERTAEFIPA